MREKRELERRTQPEVARTANVDGGYLSRLENGKSVGSVKTYLRLARALGVQEFIDVVTFWTGIAVPEDEEPADGD